MAKAPITVGSGGCHRGLVIRPRRRRRAFPPAVQPSWTEPFGEMDPKAEGGGTEVARRC